MILQITSKPDPLMMLVAIVASLVLITLMIYLQKRRSRLPVSSYLVDAMVGGPKIYNIRARTREGAIRELAAHASRIVRWPDQDTIQQGVSKREEEMSTGLENGFAVPHGRFINMGRSLVIYARSKKGIDWDCIDEKPAHNIFLLLTPAEEEEIQLKMLSEVSRVVLNEGCRTAINYAVDCREVNRSILEALSRKK